MSPKATTNSTPTTTAPEPQHQGDVTQAWAAAQRRVWDGWQEAMRQATSGLPKTGDGQPGQIWSRALDTWEPLVWQSLEAQSAAMQGLVQTLSAAPNVPQPVRAQLQQVQELTRGWNETQRQLWQAMFTMARQFTASAGAVGHQAEGPTAPAAEMLQGFARPVLEAQAAWLRQWSGLLAGVGKAQPHQ